MLCLVYCLYYKYVLIELLWSHCCIPHSDKFVAKLLYWLLVRVWVDPTINTHLYYQYQWLAYYIQMWKLTLPWSRKNFTYFTLLLPWQSVYTTYQATNKVLVTKTVQKIWFWYFNRKLYYKMYYKPFLVFTMYKWNHSVFLLWRNFCDKSSCERVEYLQRAFDELKAVEKNKKATSTAITKTMLVKTFHSSVKGKFCLRILWKQFYKRNLVLKRSLWGHSKNTWHSRGGGH